MSHGPSEGGDRDAARRIVDIGIFAHDEEGNVETVLRDLSRQSVFADDGFDPRVHLLANGCSDGTVAAARRAADAFPEGALVVHDLPEGGKSRTWNVFVHGCSREEAAFLVFLDCDIAMPETQAIARLTDFLDRRGDLADTNSRPVKDIVHHGTAGSPQEKLIAKAGGTLDDWRTSLCGQFYVLRAAVARGFHLPIGLPVEDGFVRAMVQTEVMTRDETARIDSPDGVFHVYPSERTIPSLLRHQTRIVIGGAVNAVLYAHLRGGGDAPPRALEQAARDPDWVGRLLARYLPDRRFGYVPVHFLVKRLSRPSPGLKAKAVKVLGAAFDAVVYANAQIKMARGSGAGYW